MNKTQALFAVTVLAMLLIAPAVMAEEQVDERGLIERIIDWIFRAPDGNQIPDPPPGWWLCDADETTVTHCTHGHVRRTIAHSDRVNYLDENGEWRPINGTKVPSTRDGWDLEVTKGYYHAYFNNEETKALAERPGWYLEYEEKGIVSANHIEDICDEDEDDDDDDDDKTGGPVTMDDDDDECEIEDYLLTHAQYESNFIYLASSLLQETTLLSTSGLVPEQEIGFVSEIDTNTDIYINGNLWSGDPTFTDNAIVLIHNEETMTLVDPFAYDSADERIEIGYYALEIEGKKYLIKYMDSSWLLHPDRVYPIYVDPTTSLAEAKALIKEDTYTDEAAPAMNFGSATTVHVSSYASPADNERGYYQFNISELNASSILDAEFNMYLESRNWNINVNMTATYCNDHFNESNLTWNNQGTEIVNCETLGSIDDNVSYQTSGQYIQLNQTLNATSELSDDDTWTVKLQSDPESYSGTNYFAWFGSKEHLTSSRQPYLNITYTSFPSGSGEANNLFTAIVNETDNDNFTTSTWYNSSIYDSVNATLHRGSETYLPDGNTTSSVGDNVTITFYKNLPIPLIPTNNTNLTVFWNWTFSNSTVNDSATTTPGEQTTYWAFDPNTLTVSDQYINRFEETNITTNFTKVPTDNYPTLNVLIDIDSTNNTATQITNTSTYEVHRYEYDAPTAGNKTVDGYLNVTFGSDEEIRPFSSSWVNVSEIGFTTDCSGGKPVTLHLDLLDETNSSALSGDLEVYLNATPNGEDYLDFNFTFSGVSSADICLIPSNVTLYTYGGVKYDAPSHVVENWYFVNASFSNVTTNVSLYDLDDTNSTSFEFTIFDTNFNPVEGVYLRLERFYPAENAYKTVEMAQSDSFGKGIVHLVVEDVFYRYFIFNESGTLLSTSPMKAFCQVLPCELSTFFIGADPTDMLEPIEGVSNMEATLTYNTTTQIIRYEYNDLTGTATYGRLQLYKNIGAANQSVEIFDQQVNSSSGTILANVSTEDAGQIVVHGTASRGGTVYTLVNTVKTKVSTFTMGGAGLFWAILIITLLSITMIGFNVKSAIIVLPVSMIALSVMGFISFGQNTVLVISSVVCMAALLLFTAARR